jgi:hypothetical protein
MSPADDNRIISFPGTEFTAALQIRVELLLTPQPVWRRLLVPADCDFWALHVALQDALGWPDRRPHQFAVDDPHSGQRLRFGIPDRSWYHGVHEILPGWKHPAAPFLRVDGRPVLYTYDPAEGWQHEILAEDLLPAARRPLPRCLEGAGRVPGDADAGEPFDPRDVVFDDPQQRWRRSFGHE